MPTTSKASPALVFSGHRRGRRYLVVLEESNIWLPGTLYQSLAELAYAKITSETGLAELPAVVVFRLRGTIEAFSGVDGATVIETAGGSEYRLVTHLREIWVDKTFFMLESTHVLPTEYFSVFQQHCRMCSVIRE